MKKLFTILAIIASISAIILAVLPTSNLAIFPSIAALVFGLMAFYLSKKNRRSKKNYPIHFFINHYGFSPCYLQSCFQ